MLSYGFDVYYCLIALYSHCGNNTCGFIYSGHVRWDDNVKIDEVPGGHLLQPDARNVIIHSRTSKPFGKMTGTLILNKIN